MKQLLLLSFLVLSFQSWAQDDKKYEIDTSTYTQYIECDLAIPISSDIEVWVYKNDVCVYTNSTTADALAAPRLNRFADIISEDELYDYLDFDPSDFIGGMYIIYILKNDCLYYCLLGLSSSSTSGLSS